MAIALVQSTSKVATSANNTTLAFLSNVTAGNLIAVTQAHWTTIAALVSTPVDTRVHTYLAQGAEINAGTPQLVKLRSYYVQNCTAGANTVTFDIAGTEAGELALSISEFSGAALTSALNGFVSNRNVTGDGQSTTAPTTTNLTPSVPNCMLYAAVTYTDNAVTCAEEAGWTLLERIVPAASVPIATMWKLQTTAVAEDADWVLGPAGSKWCCHLSAFAPGASGIVRQMMVYHGG